MTAGDLIRRHVLRQHRVPGTIPDWADASAGKIVPAGPLSPVAGGRAWLLHAGAPGT